MELDGYELKKEIGETNMTLSIKYGGRETYARTKRTALKRRKRNDQLYHGSRRVSIRQLLTKFKEEPEEMDLPTLPHRLMKDYDGVTSVSWHCFRQRNHGTDLSQDVEEHEPQLSTSVPLDIQKMSDEQLMQLMLEISAVEY